MKIRKPRGVKLDGTRSMNMCEHCKSFGCDPMGDSQAWRHKKDKRRSENKCVACGANPCKCKSSLSARPEGLSKREKDTAFKKKMEQLLSQRRKSERKIK